MFKPVFFVKKNCVVMMMDRLTKDITESLIREYLSRNRHETDDEVRKKCESGQLEFYQLAAMLAESNIYTLCRKTAIEQKRLYSYLVVSENEYWQDCCRSTKQSRLMVEGLASSPLNHFNSVEKSKQLDVIKGFEESCAQTTMSIENTKKQIKMIHTLPHPSMEDNRSLLYEHLNMIKEQLAILQKTYQKEVEIAEIFEKKSATYIQLFLEKLDKDQTSLRLSEEYVNKIYKALEGDASKNLIELVQQFSGEKLKSETKAHLSKAAKELKIRLDKRREEIKELAIILESLHILLKEIEKIKHTKIPIEEPSTTTQSGTSRMARFLRTIFKV